MVYQTNRPEFKRLLTNQEGETTQVNKLKTITASFAEAMLGAVMIVGTTIMIMFATGMATMGPVFAECVSCHTTIDSDFAKSKAEIERTFADYPSDNPMAVYVPGKTANDIVLMLVHNPESTTTDANTGIWTVADSYYVYVVENEYYLQKSK